VDPSEIDPTPQSPPSVPLTIAPAWHTLVLVAGILAVSIHGASRFSAGHAPINRLATHAMSVALELATVGWIILGLRLRRTPLSSLLGSFSFSFRSVAVDLGFALVFWVGSLMVLGTVAIAWVGVEAAITHRLPVTATGQPNDPSQRQKVRTLTELAPSNGKEIAAWALLCLVVGFAEEFAFRGYLQQQFIAWSRGRVPVGVALSALCFGAGHGYEGMRSMFLITVFGALFSLLALHRRALRPGMFAHAWHDFIAGMTLALLKSYHFI
jgi:uncharacterized protein